MQAMRIAMIYGALLLSVIAPANATPLGATDLGSSEATSSEDRGQEKFREYIFTQDEDLGRAISALLQSAKLGYQPALNALADVYEEGRLLPLFTGAFGNPFSESVLRVKKDQDAADFWHKLAVEAEAPDFDAEVACYLQSKSALYAEKETYMQLRAAAELGDTLAQIYLTSFDGGASEGGRDGKTSAEEGGSECGFAEESPSENAHVLMEPRA